MSAWRVKFCTGWDDEPPDTVVDVTWQAWADDYDENVDYAPIDADSADAAVTAFLAALPDWRQQYYDDEGHVWAVPAEPTP